MSSPKRRVLVLADHYLPGQKAGGPIRALAALVHHLGDRIELRILTRDRDLGDERPYESVPTDDAWVAAGNGSCRYLTPRELAGIRIRDAIRSVDHDLVYVNSIFSVPLSIKPMLLRRLGRLPKRPVVLAPRGELNPGAIGLGRRKKWVFLRASKLLGTYRDVVWQATNPAERDEIRRWFGADARVVVVPDLRITPHAARATPARATDGPLRIVFVSRISQMKNLDGALRILARVRGEVEVDIYGPREDLGYWTRCEALMHELPPNVRAEYRGVLDHADVEPVIGEYDLFFLPSLGENFGHVIVEALSAGCPILISDRTPWRGLAARGVGWDVPLEDPDEFRRVIEACCAEGPQERRQRAERAAAWAASLAPDASDLDRHAALLEARDTDRISGPAAQ